MLRVREGEGERGIKETFYTVWASCQKKGAKNSRETIRCSYYSFSRPKIDFFHRLSLLLSYPKSSSYSSNAVGKSGNGITQDGFLRRFRETHCNLLMGSARAAEQWNWRINRATIGQDFPSFPFQPCQVMRKGCSSTYDTVCSGCRVNQRFKPM